jgi:four helix bundle protein
MIQTYKDLNVYCLSYSLAMDIFKLTKTFPREERDALTDQIRRASRSISANIVEGWAHVDTRTCLNAICSIRLARVMRQNYG